jgi:hypothetical protein
VSYGNLSVFVMDLRSSRTAWNGGQLFSKDQEIALRRFLHEQREHTQSVYRAQCARDPSAANAGTGGEPLGPLA